MVAERSVVKMSGREIADHLSSAVDKARSEQGYTLNAQKRGVIWNAFYYLTERQGMPQTVVLGLLGEVGFKNTTGFRKMMSALGVDNENDLVNAVIAVYGGSQSGVRVRIAREDLGLSLLELHRASGVRTSTITQIERGRASPVTMSKNANALNGVLGIDVEQFVSMERAGSAFADILRDGGKSLQSLTLRQIVELNHILFLDITRRIREDEAREKQQ